MSTPAATAFDVEMAELAVEMIAEDHTTVTYRAKASGRTYAGGAVSGSPTDYKDVLVSPLFDYKRQYIDGETILRGDMWCVIAPTAIPVAPQSGDKLIESSGAEWAVQFVQSLRSGERTAAYILQLRN